VSVLDRRLTPARPDLAAAHLRGTVEAARYVEGRLMHVVAEVADLRPVPSLESGIDTQALFGEEVMLYDTEEGWGWVQLKRDSYVGYLSLQALAEGPAEATHRLVSNRTFIYPGPNMKLPVLGALPLNAELSISGSEGDFLRLSQGGFIFAAHAAPLHEYEKDFVGVAERLLNVPYLWGGKSPLGLDCSGLVQLSLAAAGQAAPRDTDLQEKHLGTDLAFDETLAGLKRGDVVFWKGHVGIMRDARELLHANVHHMRVASEPLAEAVARIKARAGAEITSIERLVV
jgi:cell wall-associated NlpC family hydrolase